MGINLTIETFKRKRNTENFEVFFKNVKKKVQLLPIDDPKE